MEIVEDCTAAREGNGQGAAQPIASQLLASIERLSDASTPEQACQAALDAVQTALHLDAAAVVLFPEGGKAHCQAAHGLCEAAQADLAAHLASRAGTETARAEIVCHDLEVTALEGVHSAGFLPIHQATQRRGTLALLARAPRTFTEPELALAALAVAHIDRFFTLADLRASEKRLSEAAARGADRVRRLTRISAALSSAPTAKAVCAMIIEEAHEAMGADWSGVWELNERKGTLDAIATHGMPDAMRTGCKSYVASDASNPLCLAVVNSEPLWLESWQEFARRFPQAERRVRDTQPVQVAFACLPLQLEGKSIGGLVLSFFKQRPFDPDERALMGLFAQHCAQGIERARLYDQAMDAVRVREDFLSVAGHELRTPLSTLLLQTQMSAEGADDSRTARERIAPMQRTLRRLVRLADDVMDVSRIRAGRLRIEPEPVELCALVREVANRTALCLQWPANLLRITTAGPIEGQWDPMRLEQIVVNLITNACKYGEGRPIDVHVTACPAGAELLVRDQGIGIAPADQARIFERFERSVNSREFSGLGLGLWIVREIVAAHQGTITVKSAPEEGSEFCVRLPLRPAANPG